MTEPRAFRKYTTAGIVTAFARQGIPISAISRAITVPEAQVVSTCRRAVTTGELLAMPPATPAFTRDALQLEVMALRDRVEVLQTLSNEQADTKENAFVAYLRGCPHFTINEAKIIAAFVKHSRMSKDRIYFALYGDVSDQPEPKIIDVFICKIRAKLRPHGIKIDTVWGYGYEMTRENANKLRALFDLPVIASPSVQATQQQMVA